jgi:hypothetical protein
MFSSGTMKRGLAAAAVSAMAVTGVQGLSSVAFADPGTAQAGGADAVVLAEPGLNGAITVKNDGTNTTYRLQAVGGTNVASVRFEYQIGAGQANVIATATRNDDGYFSTEWNPTVVDGASVTVRAVALSSTGATLGSSTETATVDSTVAAVNLTDGSALGVFQQPYGGANGGQLVRMRGTTGTGAGNSVNASVWNGATQDWDAHGTVPVTNGAFDGLVDIAGSYTYGATDQILLGVDNGQSADTEGFALYKQTINQVTAVADRTTVPTGQSATVTVTVTDQNNQPIGGAQVLSSNGNNTGEKYTNAQGQVTFSQAAGSATYYANVTNSPAYQPELGDKQSNAVAVTQYAAAPTKLVGSSADGAAFDLDEYASGDIAVQVQDQNGASYDPTFQTVTYHWVIAPFDGSAAITLADQTQVTDTNGRYTVNLPTGQPAGTYTLFAGLGADLLGNGAVASSQVLSVKTGQAAITLGSVDPIQAAAGGQAVVAGKLALPDGTALAGRLVNVTYANGGGDANLVLADGTTGASRQVTTDSSGAFSVTVKDVAAAAGAAQPLENGTLTATTAATPNGTFPANNAGATQSARVRFIASLAPTAVTITGGATGKPGVASGKYTVHVTNSDGDASNQSVALAVDHGFFTDGTASPAAVAGGQAGGLTSLGSAINVTTNGSGNATFRLAIARDTGFDDDGQVTATVTATAGTVNATRAQLWDSSNPLNGGTVDIKRSTVQTVGVLPKAPTNESVDYDVYATDQFGNLTDVSVAVAAGGTGQVNGGSSDTVTSEFLGASPEITISSSAAGNQAPVATWTAPTTLYTSAPPATVTGTKPLTDTGETTTWYVINFAQSKFTLGHDVASPAPVGSTVIETYTAIDQNGEPIRGQQVQFFRTGPDTLQDGTPASNTFNFQTGENGKAVYVFSGATAGTATLQALVTDANGADGTDDLPVGSSRATDTVVFGVPVTPPPTTPTAPTQAKVDAQLKGSSKGVKDIVAVKATGAAGAKVTLFKKIKGELKRLKVSTVGSDGSAKFSVRDHNGKAVTKYVVVVDPTTVSQSDTSRVNLK